MHSNLSKCWKRHTQRPTANEVWSQGGISFGDPPADDRYHSDAWSGCGADDAEDPVHTPPFRACAGVSGPSDLFTIVFAGEVSVATHRLVKGTAMNTIRWLLVLLSTFAVLPARSPAQDRPEKTFPTVGRIEMLDPQLSQLVDPQAKIEVLADGFIWAEGPVWVREGNYLLLSDIPNNRVVKWSEAGGTTTYLEPAGYTGNSPRGGETGSNGLLLDGENRLILCQHGDRRVARMDAPLGARTQIHHVG